MKQTMVILLSLILLVAFCGQNINAQEKKEVFKTEKEKVSYSIGHNMGMYMKNMGLEIDAATFQKAIDDAMKGNQPLIPEAEMQNIMRDAQQKAQQKQQAQMKVEAEKNKKEGVAFLAENAKKPGIKSTPSGIQYKVLKEGDGPKPKETDQVKVHYRGTLINGSEFDSSFKRGTPATFPLNRVIKGWTEGVQLMNVGSKYTFYIPSDLAYGDRGRGAQLPAGSTLIFDIELLEIVKDTPKAPAPKPAQPDKK